MRGKVKDMIRWIDQHPRTGWYVAIVVTLDFVMQILSKVL